MDNEHEDPHEHIDGDEWLYQHGYYDGTVYTFSRLLQQLAHDILEVSGLLRMVHKMDARLIVGVVWWHDHVMLPLGQWLRGRR